MVGVGGALSLMKRAKFITSDAAADALPLPARLVKSSGDGLNTQPDTALRSFGNSSFEMPCSTLYASPAKISRLLFCAYHPKRVTVPSLPIVLNFPEMPNVNFRD